MNHLSKPPKMSINDTAVRVKRVINEAGKPTLIHKKYRMSYNKNPTSLPIPLPINHSAETIKMLQTTKMIYEDLYKFEYDNEEDFCPACNILSWKDTEHWIWCGEIIHNPKCIHYTY
jgi:hypothetical protein